MNNEQMQFDFLDIINLISFLIAIENLQENRQQSAQNDVNAATDKQTNVLLDEVKGLFEEQNTMLREILAKVS